MNRIKEAREAKGISQRKLAAVLGLSPGSVCRYESPDDKNGPSTEMWIKMAAYFHVPVDYLMGLDSEKAATPEGDGLDAETREFIQLLGEVPVDVKLRELDYLRVQAAAKRSSADEQDK